MTSFAMRARLSPLPERSVGAPQSRMPRRRRHCLVKSLSMIRVRWRCGMSAALLVVFPAFASAQDQTPNAFRELETKYIFGFTFGSDIGAEGERKLELTTNVIFQKRTRSYVALKQVEELEYNPTDSFAIELGAAGIYQAIRRVKGFDDFHGANFGGLSSTFRYC